MTTWADLLIDEAGERLARTHGTAVALSVALHVALIVPFIELPLPAGDASERAIDITFELDPPAHGTPAPLPTPQPTYALLLPDPTPPDPPTSQDLQASEPAVALPVPAEESSLEEALAPVEAPAAIDGHEFAEARPLPPSMPAPEPRAQTLAPATAAKPQPKPQPPAATRPETHLTREARRAEAPGTASRPASLTASNGAAQRQASEDYFRQIVQKISRYRFLSRQQDSTERGLVVTRLTLQSDGGVLDVSLVKSSGSASLDSAVVDTIRHASPFPPLPSELAGGGPQSFILPVSYSRDR